MGLAERQNYIKCWDGNRRIYLPTREWWRVCWKFIELRSRPVLIPWGRFVRFVGFPDLFTPDYCLREARARGSNLLTPTICTSCYWLWSSHCLFMVHVDDFVSAPGNISLSQAGMRSTNQTNCFYQPENRSERQLNPPSSFWNSETSNNLTT